MIISIDHSLFIRIDLVSLFSNSPLYISLHNPIVKYKLIIDLNITIVPINMTRLSFGPGKKKIVFGLCKIFCFLK